MKRLFAHNALRLTWVFPALGGALLSTAVVFHGHAGAEPFPGPGGYIAALKSPVTAKMRGQEPEGVRPEDENWKMVRVGGKALDAAMFYTGGIVARDLAVLTTSQLVITTLGKEETTTIKWATHNFRGARPLGLAAYDTDKDGREELFVNAVKDGELASMMFDVKDGEYRMLASSLPYFFSATPGGRLFAQKVTQGGRKVDPAVMSVAREEGDLRLDAAFTIEGEAPLGLYGVDADGDGVLEICGILADGALAIYSPAGKLLWRAEGLGSGAKKSPGRGSDEGDGGVLRAPPKVAPVRDAEGWPSLAVGSSGLDGGLLLGMGRKDTASVRIIRPGVNGYIVTKVYVTPKTWISGLVDLSGGPLGKSDLPGFVAVNDKENVSTLYLPPDFTAMGAAETSVSFGGPGAGRRGRGGQ